jgi:peptidoglycan/xylan/chitin deacetylase (PgdA/CDA1 family)
MTTPTHRPPALQIVVYHYVRDLEQSDFPRLNGLSTDAFRTQVRDLKARAEMASLEDALAFLQGAYEPRRDLCLLTFDDGLKEHYRHVTPILFEEGIQGLFFVPSQCVEHSEVLPVHKNHFLMARLELSQYRDDCIGWLNEREFRVDWDRCREHAGSIYRWDTAEAGALKYLLNYELSGVLRDDLLRHVFHRHLGDEHAFARELYLDWDEARQMQGAGMLIGGHSHRHLPLAMLDEQSQREDLETSFELLRLRLAEQALWPFAYPYGTPSSYSAVTQRLLRDAGFACAFTTESGHNAAGQPLYALRRWDTNDVRDRRASF